MLYSWPFWRFLMHWVPCAGGRWACILAVSSYCTSARLNKSVDAVTFEEEKVGICSILQPDMQHLFRDSMKTSALMEALYCFAWQCQAQIIQQWRALQHRKLSWKAMAAFALLESISMAICAEVCSSVEGGFMSGMCSVVSQLQSCAADSFAVSSYSVNFKTNHNGLCWIR